LDVVPGVRRSISGKATETAVIANMQRLRHAGVPVGAITVLARHTAPQLIDVYKFFEAHSLSWRVLPLFGGPDSRPLERFAIDNKTIVDSLCRLFEHWMAGGAQIPITPLMEYFETTLSKIIGVEKGQLDRRRYGDDILIVNTNGDLYLDYDDYGSENVLGNIGRQTYREICASEAYARSLDRDDTIRNTYCAQCEFRGVCTGDPVFQAAPEGEFEGRCPVAYPVYRHIERWLREEAGLTDDELVHYAQQIAAKLTELQGAESSLGLGAA